jgi:hypothetical protein
MSLWDLIFYGWFAFIGLSILSVVGAAVYDSTAAKRRLAKAQAKTKEAQAAAESEEAPDEEEAEPEEAVEAAPETEADPLAMSDEIEPDDKPVEL